MYTEVIAYGVSKKGGKVERFYWGADVSETRLLEVLADAVGAYIDMFVVFPQGHCGIMSVEVEVRARLGGYL